MKKFALFFILFVFIESLSAQVPVSKEPRHHVVFENEKVRLLNVLLPPGDTTQYHVHSTPSVFICFTKTNTASQLMGQQPVAGTSGAGDIWFENLNPPHMKIHRVWNRDTAMYHVMDIEILSKDSGFTQPPLLMPHVQLQIDTSWVRTYKIELAKSETVTFEKHSEPFILVAIDNGTIDMIKGEKHSVTLQPGIFFQVKPNESFTLSNKSDLVMHFALAEIR